MTPVTTAIESIVRITWLSPKTLLMVSKGEFGAVAFEEFTDEPSELQRLVFKIRALNKKIIVSYETSPVTF